MFWFILLILVAIACAVFWLVNPKLKAFKYCADHDRASEARACIKADGLCRVSKKTADGPIIAVVLSVIATVIWLIIAICITANWTQHANNVQNSYWYLQEATIQRDALLASFDDVLENEDFIQLMNASVPDDLLFLKTNPEVSTFLLGRADRIVAVNSRLIEIRAKIVGEAKEICNYVQNPFVPFVPFMAPECKLGDVVAVTNTETVGLEKDN